MNISDVPAKGTGPTELPAKCPNCGGELLDLRQAGFNVPAVEGEGMCFAWANAMYTCVRAPKRAYRDEVVWQRSVVRR